MPRISKSLKYYTTYTRTDRKQVAATVQFNDGKFNLLGENGNFIGSASSIGILRSKFFFDKLRLPQSLTAAVPPGDVVPVVGVEAA